MQFIKTWFPPLAGALLVFGGGQNAIAATATADDDASVVVTATRSEQSRFDLPVSVDRIDREQIQQGQLQVNLSESLARVPGLVIQNRQNYAQDLQISSRGFGARSTFGVRGLRLYADGIPATMPDGQGQISHFDLGSTSRIEVLRGPFSALYGNSSGGVIAAFTEDGAPGAALDADFTAGSFDTQRSAIKFSGDNGSLNYLVDTSSFHTDGYRDHSATRRDNLNAKLRVAPDESSRLTMVVNAVDMPQALDPLGLTRAQYEADPKQAGTNALKFNTRKSVAQQQLGLTYERRLTGTDTLNATFYRGQRDTTQYQAILTATQAPATNPGGVIDLGRDYWGSDMRWTHQGVLAGTPLRTTLGLDYENLDEERKGFQNFIGTTLGVKGALRRNETNRVHNFDQYLQTQWEPSAQWLFEAGVRHSIVNVDSHDHYIVAGNGNDSGGVRFSATTPVAGVTWRINEQFHLYGAAGRGFETPTLNELSYRSISGATTGLNFGLRPARSSHYEFGLKGRPNQDTQFTAAVFHVNTRDEIVVQQNSGGRSVFQNVGKTRRDGAELAFEGHWLGGIGALVSYTVLKATYGDDFNTCGPPPCAIPNVLIRSGKLLPGIPQTSLYGELSWRHAPSGFSLALEGRVVGKVYVNDANSDAASAYAVANLRTGFEQLLKDWRFREFLRIDNLSGRRYAGSVIVNEGNQRYFEPAPARNALVGLSAVYAW